jgi:23S rRNA (uracil1939-C5)-methyltransferase
MAQDKAASDYVYDKKENTAVVTIEKLVHGGQGIGTLADGRRVFAWNVLPGEKVKLRLTKNKNKLAEGVAEEILEPSADRIDPIDEAYLSTSPWQIMPFDIENKYKQDILAETLSREHVAYDQAIKMHAGKTEWFYRNKMEYSFWADDLGLHLALFNRGSHGKRIVTGSSIAMPQIDQTATKILEILNKHGIRGSQLKTVIVRANQNGETAAALFTKDKDFHELPELADVCRGLVVYFSNPKSPASVQTKKLYGYGDITLHDDILGTDIKYDVNSFFQVNIDIFLEALKRIKTAVGDSPYIDMYSGVGTIGLSLGGAAKLVESDSFNCEMARHNAHGSDAEIIEASAETALEYIDDQHSLIVDPPRAGLHSKVTDRILEVLPPKIVYLSCNPITQARDLALLQTKYKISSIDGYNFFPRTPHIESLAVLELK